VSHYLHFELSVTILCVVVLIVVMLSVIMLPVTMMVAYLLVNTDRSVIMLFVVILSSHFYCLC
jgi:hypothetical protein